MKIVVSKNKDKYNYFCNIHADDKNGKPCVLKLFCKVATDTGNACKKYE